MVDLSEAYTASCIEEYEECGAVELDEPYYFGAMVTQPWSLASRMSITPRKMWDFADWGVRYDHGTFLRNSGLRHSRGCDVRNVAQSEYFEHQTEEEQLSEQIHLAHEESRLSEQGKTILIASATVFISAAVLFVCAYYLVRNNKKLDQRYNLVSGSPTDLYGAMEQYKL